MHQGTGSESADDAEVLAERLQSEVEDLLDAFRVRETLGRLGETHVVGSAVSRLMTHPEVDVVAHAGDGFGIGDALRVADELATRGRVVEVMATEERGPWFSGATRDERIHLVLVVEHIGRDWTLDLSLFLHDAHANVARWHEELRVRLSGDERRRILRIKRTLQERGGYPGGLPIYLAVLERGVRTVDEFLETPHGG